MIPPRVSNPAFHLWAGITHAGFFFKNYGAQTSFIRLKWEHRLLSVRIRYVFNISNSL
uniref:Uncharacterized protein n=1 Tax=Meloidogyne incognita TaxID=6306 RepID=A0A914N4J6_MELIC